MSLAPLHIRFAPRTYGWLAGRKAAGEIRAEAERLRRRAKDDLAGAFEDILILFEHLWPATMQVNRAHGDLDAAVLKAVEQLEPVLTRRFALEPEQREPTLARLWAAIGADHGGVTDPLAARFGALCDAAAGRWADQLLPSVRRAFAQDARKRCPAALPALTALEAAGRIDELLAVLTVGAPPAWALRRLGLDRLVKREGLDAALRFADQANCAGEGEIQARAAWGEARLRAAGRHDEAFARYAVAAHQGHTLRQTFESLCAAWPERAPLAIFEALRAAHPGEEGKLFATARALGDPALATALATEHPAEPKVLLHAAEEVLAEGNAEGAAHALAWIGAALRWMLLGRVYKVTRPLVFEAADLWVRAHGGDPSTARAELQGLLDQARAEAPRTWLRAWLAGEPVRAED